MSLGATILTDLQGEYPSQFDRQEWRREQYGFVDSAIEQTASTMSILSTDVIEKAKMSEGRPLEIPVLDYKDVTITDARTCDVQPFENDSSMVTLTWKTIVADISMNPQEYKNNVIKYQEDLMKKLTAVSRSMLKVIDQDIQVAVDAQKAQFFNSTFVGAGNKYPLNLGAVSASQAQKQMLFNDLDAIQDADDFDTTEMQFIGNIEWKSLVREFINQGNNNGVNTSWEFDPFKFHFSKRVPQNAGSEMTGYYMPTGTLGFLTRLDGMADMGYTSTKGHEWFAGVLPEFPFEVGFKFDSDCDDLSSVQSHMTASAIEKWQISLDYAICLPYFSGDIATTPRSVKKVEVTIA